MIEPLVRIWTALHSGMDVIVAEGEMPTLRRLPIGMDDDLVAALFAAKLRLARAGPTSSAGADVVRAGSEVAFVLDGTERRCVLTHGGAVGPDRLGTTSRIGAALMCLRAGQSLLWPDERWRLVELVVTQVVTSHVGRPSGSCAAPRTGGDPCACG